MNLEEQEVQLELEKQKQRIDTFIDNYLELQFVWDAYTNSDYFDPELEDLDDEIFEELWDKAIEYQASKLKK